MIWSLLRSVCLAVWWFNPLVWLAAALSRQDCELACDEGTIKALGESARFDYGRTLVGMAAVGRANVSELLCGATTMTGSGSSLKVRVARIAQAPKKSVVVAGIVLVIAAAAAGCTFSGAADSPGASEEAPPHMYLSVFDPVTGADATTVVYDAQETQEMYDLYLFLRDKAVVMDTSYDIQHGAPIYYVDFFDGPAPELPEDAFADFQMWEGGQFLFYVADKPNGEESPQLVYFSEEYGRLFEDILDKYYAESVKPLG